MELSAERHEELIWDAINNTANRKYDVTLSWSAHLSK
jgi:hypothetical protein